MSKCSLCGKPRARFTIFTTPSKVHEGIKPEQVINVGGITYIMVHQKCAKPFNSRLADGFLDWDEEKFENKGEGR